MGYEALVSTPSEGETSAGCRRTALAGTTTSASGDQPLLPMLTFDPVDVFSGQLRLDLRKFPVPSLLL